MTDITELTQEAARESGSILIIVAARMARREFFTPLHALCESGKRVVSTRALCDAVERAEERMVSQVPKIVDGHDRMTKKLKEAESRNAELVEALENSESRLHEVAVACATAEQALEKAQQRNAELEAQNEYIRKRYQQRDLLIGENILVSRLQSSNGRPLAMLKTGWRGFITRSSGQANCLMKRRKTHRHISTANMLRSMKSLWRFTSGFGNKARLNVPPLASRWRLSDVQNRKFRTTPQAGSHRKRR